jgi:hypothetical protein
MTDKGFILPSIPAREMTPTVKLLLAIIEQQHDTIARLEQRIDRLEAEVARLKKLPPRPGIKPSALDKDHDDDDPSSGGAGRERSTGQGKRPGSKKRRKRTRVHHTRIVPPEDLPPGSRLMGYQDYLVQDMLIEPCNTRYRLARYRTPDGRLLTGQLPPYLQGTHFGPTLQSFILYQYHHQRVTQPLLLQQLREWGIDISSGQLNRIITEDKERFHAEKTDLLPAGIAHSSYLQVDDTGARHAGKNGYCTHLGNDQFACFESTSSKNRINFLKLLRGPDSDYVINPGALDYMHNQGLPAEPLLALRQGGELFPDETAWNAQLDALGIHQARHVRIATEGGLIGSLIHHGFPPDLVILSDDAGQFDVFLHALCWIHAERVFQRILPLNQQHTKALDWVTSQIWDLYHDLKHYRIHPDSVEKQELSDRFDEICRTKTGFQTLNLALERLANNKAELLLVLDRPDIPLHNNLSERDIREYVIKRKISGSTRSDEGRRCRDTFASLKKTCKKQRIAFWDYLLDRVNLTNNIPYLPNLIRRAHTTSS